MKTFDRVQPITVQQVTYQCHAGDCVCCLIAEVTFSTEEGLARKTFRYGVSRGDFYHFFKFSNTEDEKFFKLAKLKLDTEIAMYVRRLNSLANSGY